MICSSVNLDRFIRPSLPSGGLYVFLEEFQGVRSAKTNQDAKAVKLLAAQCQEAVSSLALYCDCNALCAIPPSPDKEWDLPTQIVGKVSEKTGLDDLSSCAAFGKVKQNVKAVPLADKWATLEKAKLNASNAFKGRRVILIDDKYQSGTTMQFVASKLMEAGADQVLGLSCVKTWRDTDNT